MPEVTVIATVHPKPGHADDLLREMKANAANVHDEPGCLHYTYHRGIDDPDAIVVIERWASEDALIVHSKAPHMAAFAARAQHHRAAPTDVVRYEMVPTEGDPKKSNF